MRLVDRHDRVLHRSTMPRWNPISISGYHIREAGATAAQELAFTLADGIAYVEACVAARARRRRLRAAAVVLLQRAQRLLRGDREVPRGAPHLGARACASASAPRTPRSLLLRFHTQTAGVSLTAQQPLNNIVRTASRRWRRCWAAPSRCTPTASTRRWRCRPRRRRRLALRTQQIIAYETGVADAVDPLGGCYCVESLTDEMERAGRRLLRPDRRAGRRRRGDRAGFFQREIADARLPLPARGREAASGRSSA